MLCVYHRSHKTGIIYLTYTMQINPIVGRYTNPFQSHGCYRTHVQPIGATCPGDQCESRSSEDAQGPFPGSSLNNEAAIGFGRCHFVCSKGEQGKFYMFLWFVYMFLIHIYIRDILEAGLNGWKVPLFCFNSYQYNKSMSQEKGWRHIFHAQHSTF